MSEAEVGPGSALAAAVPGLRHSEAEPDRLSYARDLWPRHHLQVRSGRLPGPGPATVVWPESAAEVAGVVAWCAREGIPITPYGAGSGVCGAVLPDARTVVIDTKRLRRWRILDEERGLLEVDAGVLGIRLEEELAPRGYTVGHFPSSILCSTVGGWVAARGAGQCSGLYGKIEDMVVALDCVDGRGERARLRRRVGGPDVGPLVVGSEGVLAVVTSATLRLHPAPAHRAFAGLLFPTMRDGWEAIRAIYQAGLRPAVARLYDPLDSAMARRALGRARREGGDERGGAPPVAPGLGGAALRRLLRHPGALNRAIAMLGGRLFGGALLVLVFEGTVERCRGELADAERIGAAAGARALGEAPARHWLAHRYSVSYRQAPMIMGGAFVDTMEVAAPWSRLGALYDAVRCALGRHVLVMAHMSHAYPDGCSIYFTFAGAAGSDEACERRYDEAWRSALAAAVEAGGTISHHHGVGRSKAPRLGAELGLGIEMVRALRRAFDPAGILNPGNLEPAGEPVRRALSDAPAAPLLDGISELVTASGAATLADVERALDLHGLSLGLGGSAPDRERTSVAAWIAAGGPGAPDPWLDPVDHVVAGFEARLASGAPLVVRPCPRRAVGPDLLALFWGAGGRVGRIHAATLRARGPAPPPLACGVERDPAPDAAETAWTERALAAAAAAVR